MMNGRTTIRASGSQAYSEKNNEDGQDAFVLAQVVMFGSWQWFSL
jgi:hypothetical protein